VSNLTASPLISIQDKVAILVEALPYIVRFSGATFVIKYGGNVLGDSGADGAQDALESFAQDVVLLQSVGIRPVVVHGGGPQIDHWLRRLAITPHFVDGLRVTDAATLEIVKMVLLGQVNPDIVAQVNRFGGRGVGISGADGSFVRCHQRSEALGFVGAVDAIDPVVMTSMLDDGIIPVVASIGVDAAGQAYNINADHVASAIAGALEAEKLVYLTNVEGLRERAHDPSSLIHQVSSNEVDAMIARGVITGGMIPKVRSAIDAIKGGVRSVHLLDGTMAHALLLEIFTDKGIGTMIHV
jgi:acetylglutamate kinase